MSSAARFDGIEASVSVDDFCFERRKRHCSPKHQPLDSRLEFEEVENLNFEKKRKRRKKKAVASKRATERDHEKGAVCNTGKNALPKLAPAASLDPQHPTGPKEEPRVAAASGDPQFNYGNIQATIEVAVLKELELIEGAFGEEHSHVMAKMRSACDAFLTGLPIALGNTAHDEIGSMALRSKHFLPNPKNERLRRREQATLMLLKRFRDELCSWQEVEQTRVLESSNSCNLNSCENLLGEDPPATADVKSTELVTSSEEAMAAQGVCNRDTVPVEIERTVGVLNLHANCIKEKMAEAQQLLVDAERAHRDLAASYAECAFRDFKEVNNPTGLLRALATGKPCASNDANSATAVLLS